MKIKNIALSLMLLTSSWAAAEEVSNSDLSAELQKTSEWVKENSPQPETAQVTWDQLDGTANNVRIVLK